MASRPILRRGHTVSFESTKHSADSVEGEEPAVAASPQLTAPLRPRLHTEPSCRSPDQVEQPGRTGRENQGEVLWQVIRAQHRNLLEGETYQAHCSVSVAISNRSGAQRARRYSFSSSYHKLEVFVTDYSLHFFKQRRAVTFNGFFDITEVYHSFPLVSLQNAAILEREEQNNCLKLDFQRNEVKVKFSDEDSASQLHHIIMANREECMVRSRQQQSHLLPGSSSSGALQQFHSLSTAAGQREDERAAQDLRSYRWLDHLFVRLLLRPPEVYQPLENQGEFCFRSRRWKHLESERSVIKYPAPGSVMVLPAECYFRMDDVHVALLWKSPTEKHYKHRKCITLDQVVEVRRGQQTEGFGKFPYRATERHSLSFMFEAEKKVRAFSTNRYVTLHSIDIVCETSKEADDWIDAIGEYHFDTGKQLFPNQLKYLDHTLIWLKTNFSVLGTHFGEISFDKVNKFCRSVRPDLNSIDIHKWFMYAKSCMQHDTTLNGALTWKGFVSVYDHFVDMEAKRLFALFSEFAVEKPNVGMAVAEFRRFLIESQKWSEESCSQRECRKLMDRYDQHHSLYKERVARAAGTSSPLQLSLYLSFPGFVSFVRGKDNQIISPLHEEVYQDMTRPLSHYFINSSHNTFLEGHQLRGNSSYDAYIRPLLHGVRCLEIDCWDDEVRGIVVTHGNTPTTRLSFPRVLKTIKEYAFAASVYPLILSLENHCSKENRKRMAKLLEEEFGDHLVREDMEAWQRRDHLPSPTDLKHKILLKDSFRYQRRDQNGETPCPEVPSSSNGSSPHPCPPQPTSPQLPTGHSLSSRMSLPGGISLSTSPRPPSQCSAAVSLGRTGRSAVTFDIPDDKTENDHLHKPRPKRQVARTFHGLGHHSSNKRPVFVGPDHLALDRSISAPASTDDDNETDGPLEDNLQFFGWNFLSRFSRVEEEEAREQHERRTEEEHINEKEMAQELTNLICLRSQKIKPGQLWAESHNLRPFEMLSFKETKAMEHCKENAGDLLQLSTRCLLRVYPKGYRIASENYNPIPLWNYGMQLVALNHQTPDMCLHINQGKFRQNGSCGYILKPACLQERLPHDLGPGPHTAVHSDTGDIINLEVKFVSAQNLSPASTQLESFKIWVALSGTEHDSTSNMESFRKLSSDTPLFEGRGQDMPVSFFDFPEGTKLSHPLVYSELCMLYVRVEIQAERSMGRRPTPILFGQNAIPVDSLREGLRFLPLRDISGHLIHQSGFFVLVHKTALKPSRRGGLVPRTTITSENGDLYTSQGVQNGDQSHDRSDLTSSANTHQKDRQKHFSRQDSIEEEPTSSQVVVVELH